MNKAHKKLNAFVASGIGIRVPDAPSTLHFSIWLAGSDHLEPLARGMGVAAILPGG